MAKCGVDRKNEGWKPIESKAKDNIQNPTNRKQMSMIGMAYRKLAAVGTRRVGTYGVKIYERQ